MKGLTSLLFLVASAGLANAQVLDGSGAPDISYPGFYAWFDAAAGVNGPANPVDGDPVARWSDSTGQGHNLVRVDGDSSRRPTWRANAANGLPALAFDGDDYLWGNSSTEFGTLAGGKTILAAVRVNVADGGYVFDGTSTSGRNAVLTGQTASPLRWNLYAGNDPATEGPYVDTGIVQVHSFVFDAGAQALFLNGALVGSGSAALADLRGLVVGARYTLANGLDGDVAELLIYDEVLSDADRQALEGYLLAKHPVTEPPLQPTFVEVFEGGAGYPAFRIPALLTTAEGTLLAFAEGRASLSDHAQNDIVMRRSTDRGDTWGPLVLLADDGGNSLNNPCAVQVREGPHTGRIYVMYQRYPEGCHESCVVAGYTGPDICRGFLVYSDDDGLTWSAPREVTTEVKRPTGATSIAGGPGVGIQKRRPPNAGRLIVPFNQGPNPNWKLYAAYSDDGGDTWAYGDLVDDSQTPGTGNEVQMVELTDGSLLLNSRSSGGTHHRKIAHSFDGGETWTPLADELQLVEPQCMASVLRFTDPLDGFHAPRLLYAGPMSQTARVDGTVHLSYDEGQTWATSKLLWGSFYAYSVLTVLADQEIGLLFESSGYARITFARLPVEWVTDGLDCVGTIAPYCPASPNSVGSGVQLSASGGNGVSANQTTLWADGGPGGQPALFYYGPDVANVPFGDGVRCVGGPTFRLLPPVPFDASGTVARPIDLPAPPTGSGPGQVTPGSSFSFQVWYRDPAAGASGFNLSNGLRVTFCP